MTNTRDRPHITTLAAYPLGTLPLSSDNAMGGQMQEIDVDRRRRARATRVARLSTLHNQRTGDDINPTGGLPLLLLRRESSVRRQTARRVGQSGKSGPCVLEINATPLISNPAELGAKSTGEAVHRRSSVLLLKAEAHKHEVALRRYKADSGADSTDTALAKALDLYARTSLMKVASVRRRSTIAPGLPIPGHQWN